MKIWKVIRTSLGAFLQVLGIIVSMFVAAADPMKTESVMAVFIGLLAGFSLYGVGYILEYPNKLYKYLVPVAVIVGSAIFTILQYLSKPFKDVYRIKKKCGSCKALFELSKEFYSDDIHN